MRYFQPPTDGLDSKSGSPSSKNAGLSMPSCDPHWCHRLHISCFQIYQGNWEYGNSCALLKMIKMTEIENMPNLSEQLGTFHAFH